MSYAFSSIHHSDMLSAPVQPIASGSRAGLSSTDASISQHESASSSGWSSPVFKPSDLDLYDVETRLAEGFSVDEDDERDLQGQMTPPSTAPPSAYSASCFGFGSKHTPSASRHPGQRAHANDHSGQALQARDAAASVVNAAGAGAADEMLTPPETSSPLSSASSSDVEGETSEDELGIDVPAAMQHAHSVLLAEAKALMDAASRLQSRPSEFERAIKTIVNCVAGGGKVVWTGVGKSGIIARKLHASSLSLGLSSAWLCPISALHGDLGTLSGHWPQAPRPPLLRARMAEHRAPPAPVPDVLCALSHSGESAELLNLLPHAKARGCPILAFTSKSESSLAKAARSTRGAWVDCRTASPAAAAATPALAANNVGSAAMRSDGIGATRSATFSNSTAGLAHVDSAHCACCPHHTDDASSTSPTAIPGPSPSGSAINTSAEADALVPAPTSSTTVALAMGDSLVLSVARACGLGVQSFKQNHPGGALGARLVHA